MTTMILMAIYLIAMLVVGLLLKNKIDDTRDYYVAGRSLPWYLMTMTMAATYIGASATLADTGLAYDEGMSAFLPCLAGMVGMLVFGIISPKVSKIGFKYDIVSVSGLISYRFGRLLGCLSAIVVAWALIGTLAGQVSGSGTVITLMFKNIGVTMSFEMAITIMVVVMVVYTTMGGMFGVAWTDFIQCIILIIGMAMLLPALMIPEAGGISGISEAVPEGWMSFKPSLYILGLTFTFIMYFMAGPPYWQRAFSAKTPTTSRLGTVLAVCIITAYSFMICLLGCAAKALMPETAIESQGVVVTLMTQLFHPIIAAIVTCAIIAAIMSTMSSYLLTSVQAIITDIIKPYKPMSEKLELILAKVLVAVVGIAALVFALYVRGILDALSLAMGFYSACMCAPVIAAVFWKKATKPAAYCAFFAGAGTYLVWKFAVGGALNPSIPGGIVSIALMVIISLLTYREETATPYWEGVSKDDDVVDTRRLAKETE